MCRLPLHTQHYSKEISAVSCLFLWSNSNRHHWMTSAVSTLWSVSQTRSQHSLQLLERAELVVLYMARNQILESERHCKRRAFLILSNPFYWYRRCTRTVSCLMGAANCGRVRRTEVQKWWGFPRSGSVISIWFQFTGGVCPLKRSYGHGAQKQSL